MEHCSTSYFLNVNKLIFKNQIIINLLSNAIKFSHENSSINIKLIEDDDLVKIKIKDSGMGIPKELMPKLFDSKEQTSRVGTDGETGTGFGLPLVKEFVNEFEGHVEVESTTEKEDAKKTGTTFTISFKNAA